MEYIYSLGINFPCPSSKDHRLKRICFKLKSFKDLLAPSIKAMEATNKRDLHFIPSNKMLQIKDTCYVIIVEGLCIYLEGGRCWSKYPELKPAKRVRFKSALGQLSVLVYQLYAQFSYTCNVEQIQEMTCGKMQYFNYCFIDCSILYRLGRP